MTAVKSDKRRNVLYEKALDHLHHASTPVVLWFFSKAVFALWEKLRNTKRAFTSEPTQQVGAPVSVKNAPIMPSLTISPVLLMPAQSGNYGLPHQVSVVVNAKIEVRVNPEPTQG
jgi:hypothetical protein